MWESADSSPRFCGRRFRAISVDSGVASQTQTQTKNRPNRRHQRRHLLVNFLKMYKVNERLPPSHPERCPETLYSPGLAQWLWLNRNEFTQRGCPIPYTPVRG